MSGGQAEKHVQLTRDFAPDVIMAAFSFLLNIADEMDRQGVDTRELSLRVGHLEAIEG